MFEYIPEWTSNRANFILNIYGKQFFQNKTILELGSMYGEIGNFFAEHGAKVTCYEGREENLKKAVQKFPNLDLKLINIENLIISENYDIIFNMGILYHLESVDNLLKQCAKSCKYMILETEVIDSNKDLVIDIIDSVGYDQAISLSRLGKRPSQLYIENRLQELEFKYTRYDSVELDSGPHVYSWKNNYDESYVVARRRFWMCEKL